MFKKTIFLLVVVSQLIFGSELYTLDKGVIKAHTEVFGDSTINPETKEIKVKLSKNGNIDTLRGEISFNTTSLISDNSKRDEHMVETLNASKYNTIKAVITNIMLGETKYIIWANLTLNGVTKEIKAMSEIKNIDGKINLNGKFYINMSDYNINPPKLLFLTVRDGVDLYFDIFIKE